MYCKWYCNQFYLFMQFRKKCQKIKNRNLLDNPLVQEVLPKVKKGHFRKCLLTTNLIWEVLPKVKKDHFWKYFQMSKKVILGSTS